MPRDCKSKNKQGCHPGYVHALCSILCVVLMYARVCVSFVYVCTHLCACTLPYVMFWIWLVSFHSEYIILMKYFKTMKTHKRILSDGQIQDQLWKDVLSCMLALIYKAMGRTFTHIGNKTYKTHWNAYKTYEKKKHKPLLKEILI